jgi:cysteine-rich repeat protein
MLAVRVHWAAGVTAALAIGVPAPTMAQPTAPPLTACELARLRSVPRWELDYSYRLASSFTASGETATINSGFFQMRDWTYADTREQEFRLVVPVGPPDSRPAHVGPECSETWPCEPDHPADLSVMAHADSRSLVGRVCPGQHGVGCPGPDACFEAGGHPFCGEACQYDQRSDVTAAAPSAVLDGTTGQRISGEMYFDFDVNPPTATAYFGVSSPPGTMRNQIAACLNGPTDNTFDVNFGAFTDFAPYPTTGGDTAVRLMNGRFVVQGGASGSDTRNVLPPIADPDPPGPFQRTWTGEATWTLREAGEPVANVVGIEVNQAVQDWQQSVPLISGKPAVVRVHMEPVGEDPLELNARLRGFRGGVELPGSPLAEDAANVFQAASEARVFKNQTFDWVLPPAWLDGDVELCLDSKTPLGCTEPAESGGAPGDCGVRVSFGDAPPLRVKFVAVEWGLPLGTRYKPAATDLDELEDRLAAILPTAQLDVTRGELRLFSIGKPDLGRVNRRLDALRLADCAAGEACDRTYYGVLTSPDRNGFPYRGFTVDGLANGIPGTVSSGIYPPDPQDYSRHVHTHEIGHVLGRPHAVDPTAFGTDGAGNPQGPCGEVADAGAEVFPFFFGVDGSDVPALGPLLSGEASKIYGFDTHWNKIIDPTETFELMGYCAGRAVLNTGRSKWISGHTYAQLKAFLATSWFGGTPTPPPSGTAGDVMMFGGSVDEDAGTAELAPVMTLPSAHASEPPASGTYALELRDAGGSVLASVPLTPLYQQADAPGMPHDTSQGSFTVLVPAAPGAAAVALSKDGVTRAIREASAHAPEVTVVFPNGGDEIGPGEAALAWAATDADGDALTFLVQWSRDGGATWDTLDPEASESSLTIDTDLLAATTSGRLRVVASDGFLGAVDESDGDVTVPPKAPRVRILAPTGTVPIVGARAALLRGAAHDVEDGPLADARLRWSSDLNGNLGTGGMLVLDGTVLVRGLHLLTLTATDNDGLIGTATVPLVVVAEGPICGDGSLDPGEVCDDGNLVGGDECAADCSAMGTTTTSLGGTTTSTVTTTTIGGGSSSTTTTTTGGGSTTSTTIAACPGGCDDDDPCTEEGCVAGTGCVVVPRTGIAGAACHCGRTPPDPCGGAAPPPSLARPFDRACDALALLADATGKREKKLARRATAQLKRAARVARKLGKRKLEPACADAWRARFLEAAERLGGR